MDDWVDDVDVSDDDVMDVSDTWIQSNLSFESVKNGGDLWMMM